MSNRLSIVLPVMSAFALAVTTLIGVLGVKYEFRDKASGQIKTSGKIVIALTLVAFVLGFLSLIGDAYRKNLESKKAEQDITDLHARLNKPLLPISGLKVVYAVDVTRSNLGNGNTSCYWQPLPFPRTSVTNGRWNQNWIGESGIREALNPPDVYVTVFRQPVDASRYTGKFEREPDLSFRTDESPDYTTLWQSDCGKRIGFFGRAIDPSSSTAAIMSTIELDGAQIVIDVEQHLAGEAHPPRPKLIDVELMAPGRGRSSITKSNGKLNPNLELGTGWIMNEVLYEDEAWGPIRATLFSRTLQPTDLRECCLAAEQIQSITK